ncbi:hypothetical protein LOAG_01882 [Loa loa]|uniref:Uncharacterized protein n=1 Tax=Loa loa TaxID=7209 RepID=A0A1S0U7P7_LOALO|nr:hypothetical protein LOAG_01882 [Loa loa]EFO26594.1 hypothetical protein LOAG_01882 [Loa loa]
MVINLTRHASHQFQQFLRVTKTVLEINQSDMKMHGNKYKLLLIGLRIYFLWDSEVHSLELLPPVLLDVTIILAIRIQSEALSQELTKISANTLSIVFIAARHSHHILKTIG